ncbi:MAG: hypothetical protein AAF135_18810 [Bacteroidota bacterium]
MKSILTIILFALGFTTIFAQDTGIYERAFEFDKRVAAQANGLVYKANAPKALVQTAIDKKFDEVKSKSKNMRKDLIIFEGVVLGSVSMQTMDYYFRLKELSPEQTEVQMFVSLGNDNFITGEKYPKEVAAAGVFLKDLTKAARITQMEKAIAAQQALLIQKQKEQEDILKQAKTLVEDKVKLEKELEDNKAKQAKLDQQKQDKAAQVEAETKKLNEMTSKMVKIKNQ